MRRSKSIGDERVEQRIATADGVCSRCRRSIDQGATVYVRRRSAWDEATFPESKDMWHPECCNKPALRRPQPGGRRNIRRRS